MRVQVLDCISLDDAYNNYRRYVWGKDGPTWTCDEFAARLAADGHSIQEIGGRRYLIDMWIKSFGPGPDRERVIKETVAQHGYRPRDEQEFFDAVLALKSELAERRCYVFDPEG